MATVDQRNGSVYDLLHDARIARDAADMAKDDGNQGEMVRLRGKARTLVEEAGRVDPTHEAPAWDNHLRGTN